MFYRIELNVAIICGSAAALQPLLVRIAPSILSIAYSQNTENGRSTGRAPKSGQGVYDYNKPSGSNQFSHMSRVEGGREKADSEEFILFEEPEERDTQYSPRISAGGYQMGKIHRTREVRVEVKDSE
jgi:hypothetical protein